MAKPNLIPKVYAVYRKSEGVSPQVFASVSTVFPEFQDLKTYLSAGLCEEKLTFLIENGFPEICALSYFLEEDDLHKGNIGISDGNVVRIDFDMSAFSIVGKQDFRGSRSSLDSRRLEDMFVITAKDIEHFPELSDAKPYYFPGIFRMVASANGYTAEESKNLNALQKDSRFVKRAYLTFLKIILLPDSIFNNLLSAHIGDPKIVSELSEHFIQRKQILREVLLLRNECHKFKNFLETLSAEDIRSLFHEVLHHNLKNKFEFQQVNLQITQSRFCEFILDSMKTGDLIRFLELTAKVAENFSADELSVLEQARKQLLHRFHHPTEKALFLPEDVFLFVDEMRSNIAKIKSLFVTPDQSIDAVYMNINLKLDRLERYAHAAQLSEVMRVSSTEEFDLIDLPVDEADQPIINQRKLVLDTIRWLQEADKKSTVVVILERILADIRMKQATIMAMISSAVVSAATSASSFFVRAPSASISTIASQLQKLLADFDADNQVFRAVFRVLSLTGDGSEQLKNQIIFEFIAQFVQEFSRKNPIEQMEVDPVLSGFLSAHHFFSYPSPAANELIALFKSEVQPYVSCFMEPCALAH
jgi:acetolactate synthase regulatory subunit